MNAVEWARAHRRSMLFLLALLVAGGLASALVLPVALFPQVDFPRIRVNVDAGDRPAGRMVIEVTKPMEEAARAVPGVVSLRSTTSRGSAELSIQFGWGEDMVRRFLEVESAINHIKSGLPQGTTFEVRRMDPTVFPVLAYSMSSDTLSLTELRDIAEYQLRPLLSSVNGVAKIGVQGGAVEEYHVSVDEGRLNSFGLALTDISKALSASNVIKSVGRLEDHYKLYLVVSDTSFDKLATIQHTVVRSGKDGLVLLSDVAKVEKATAPQWIRVTAAGRDAVTFNIYQQPGGNTVEINREIKAKLNEFEKRMPRGLQIANWYDQSELILASARSVRDAMIAGAVLAAFILLIFLRSSKITLIVVIALPGVLAATVLLLYTLHMSFNIMTLGAMAAAVGLIIDDTIVILEHIIRRLRTGPVEQHRKATMDAARELTRPLMGSSAATIIIFLPLAFLSRVTGAFFRSLALTVAASLFISFLVAWLAEPIFADHFLGAKDAAVKEGGRLTELIHKGYEATVGRLLKYPWLVPLIMVPLIMVGWFCYKGLGSGFMPSIDEGGFILDYRAPPGTSLTETDRLLRQVEGILQSNPYVETYSRRTGLALGGTLSEANEGDFFVRLKPSSRPPIWTVMDGVRSEVEHGVPGLKIEMAQLMEDLIGDLTAVPQPIEVKIYSDDEKSLLALGPKVAQAISRIRGVVEVKNGVVLAGDALEIKVDRAKASLEGVDPESITATFGDLLEGAITTRVLRGPKMVGVRLWAPRNEVATEWNVRHIRLRAPDGHQFPLERIASVTAITGEPQIMRDDLKRMIAVTGRISGRDMGSTVSDVKKVLAQPGLIPKGVFYTLGGLYEQQQIAFAGLMKVFVAAVMLVFLLLLFLYENFRMAVAIMTTTLLAASGVFIGLRVTGVELNISSMMGLTMVVGMITEVAIFYVSEYAEVQSTMDRRQALITAGKNRMRPIAMSTFAAILALLPLAMAIGSGSAMQQPLAIAIISGLVLNLPLTLIVLPVLLGFSVGRPKQMRR